MVLKIEVDQALQGLTNEYLYSARNEELSAADEDNVKKSVISASTSKLKSIGDVCITTKSNNNLNSLSFIKT